MILTPDNKIFLFTPAFGFSKAALVLETFTISPVIRSLSRTRPSVFVVASYTLTGTVPVTVNNLGVISAVIPVGCADKV